MGQIIGCHPQAVLIDESDDLYRWTDACLKDEPTEVKEALFEKCCRLASGKYRDPDTKFDRNGRLRAGVNLVVLKAPNLTFAYASLRRAFAEPKVVYMFRDIRDVVASVFRLTNVPILRNQMRYIAAGPQLEKRFPEELALLRQSDASVPPHVKMALVARIKMSLVEPLVEQEITVARVRYEDLVGDAERVIAETLGQLGIRAAEECLGHETRLGGAGPGGTRRERKVDVDSVGKWRNGLTETQAKEIWAEVGDFMEQLGYG